MDSASSPTPSLVMLPLLLVRRGRAEVFGGVSGGGDIDSRGDICDERKG
jgi:hypothetical protein